MHTKTSHSKIIFFTSTLKQYYWVFVLQLIALMVIYPISLAMASLQPNVDLLEMALELHRYTDTHPATFILILFPVLYGVLSFSYLSKETECLRMHSLPVTRKRLFIEHFTGAFCLMAAPYLMTALCILLVELAIPNLAPQLMAVGLWLFISLFFGSIFLCTAVFSAMIIGHPLFVAAFTYIVLLLPFGLQQLITFSLDQFLRGYSTSGSDFFMFLSPLAGFLMGSTRGFTHTFYLLHWLFYGFTAVLFLGLAYYLYEKRALENIDEMVQFPILKPILKYLATLCTLLLFGLLFNLVTNTAIGMIPGYLIGGILGYILSEMILQKNMRCHISFKNLSMAMVLFFAVFALIATDAFHYGNRSIGVTQIKQVYFNHYPYPGNERIPNLLFDDPTTVEAVQRLYQQTTQNVSPLFWLDNTHEATRTSMDFAFVDQNGNLFKRHYSLNDTLVTDALNRVYHSPEYLSRMVPITTLDMANVESAHVNGSMGESDRYLLADLKQVDTLLAAIKEDIKNNPNECFSSAWAVPTCSVQFDLIDPPKDNYGNSPETYVQIYPHYKNTLAVLKGNPNIEKFILTSDKVTKIRIKALKDYDPVHHTSPLNSVEIFGENDPAVVTITDPALIETLIDTPLYQQGKSMEDTIVNIYTDGENPVYYGYYIGKLPFAM